MAKLCPRGKAAAKRKFKVYPSAYANMYASAVCSGKVTPGGKKKRKKAMWWSHGHDEWTKRRTSIMYSRWWNRIYKKLFIFVAKNLIMWSNC